MVNMQVVEESRRHQVVQKYEVYPLNTSDIDNYQVELTGLASSVKEDARIIQDDILNQWIESKRNVWSKLNNLKAKTPQIILGLSGNPSSEDVDDGEATFPLLFDDFPGASLDTNKWSEELKGTGASVIIANGECELNVPDNQVCSSNIRSVDTFVNNIAIHVKRKCPSDNEYIGFSLGAGTVCDDQGGTTDWWMTSLKSGYWWLAAPADTDCKIYEMPASGAKITLTSAFSLPNIDINNYRTFEYIYDENGLLIWVMSAQPDVRPLGEGFEKYASNPLSLPGDSTGYGVVHPDVLYFPSGEDGYKYWMYYEKGITSPDCEVYLVRSNDGITWVETGITNPILDNITSEEHIPDPDVIKVGATWYMFIIRGTSGSMQVYRLTSSDGKAWSDPQLVIDKGGAGAWDENDVVSPSVIYEDGIFYLWYTAKDISASLMQVGLATSPDGLNFTKDASNPIFRGEIGKWDEEQIWHIQVTKYDGYYWLYYVADSTYAGGNYKMGLAKSTDRKNFTHSSHNPIMTKSGTGWETDFLYRMSWLQDGNGNGILLDNKLWLYYSAYGGSYYKIGLAKSWDQIDLGADRKELKSVTDTTFLNNDKKVMITQGAYSNAGRGTPTFLEHVFIRKYETNEPIIQNISKLNRASLIKTLGSRL